MGAWRLAALVLGAALLALAGPAGAGYGELDDGSGGIAGGYGVWGPWDAVREPAVTDPGRGVITVYHPDTDPAPRPVVFFISGWGQPADSYDRIFRFIASHGYTAVDVYNEDPGSITSSYPNAVAMIERAATDFAAWIDTTAVGLAGHSFGGGAAVWVGKRIFGDHGWGTDGRRFLFLTAPWLTFLTTRADLETYPPGVKLVVQINDDDVTSHPDYVWNTDPRAIRAVYELIAIPPGDKDFETVFSDTTRTYPCPDGTCTYLADHYLCYTGIWDDGYHPYDALDVHAINRHLHALMAWVFEGDAAARLVALGDGHPAQTGMGWLPPLAVTDAPVVTRDEDLYLYRCHEDTPGTWGDPNIWKLQDYCDDSDGDGIIDALDTGTATGDPPGAPLALLGAEPNPFNPRTHVHFALAAAMPVRLEVRDLRGRLVRLLHDGPLAAGRHTVAWDGRDDRGRAAPSGTYLIRLTGRGTSAERSVTLVR